MSRSERRVRRDESGAGYQRELQQALVALQAIKDKLLNSGGLTGDEVRRNKKAYGEANKRVEDLKAAMQSLSIPINSLSSRAGNRR